MTGFGAIVKSAQGWAESALSEAARGLRLILDARRPRPCPIPVRAAEERPRRRDGSTRA